MRERRYVHLSVFAFFVAVFFSHPEEGFAAKTAFPGTPPPSVVERNISSYLGSSMTRSKIPGAEAKAAEYARLLVSESRKRNVDPYVAAAVLLIESGGRESVVAGGCVGLMQIKWSVHKKWVPRTFPGIRSLNDMKKAQNNIAVGVAILGDASKRTTSLRGALYRYRGKKDDRYVAKVMKHVSSMSKRK